MRTFVLRIAALLIPVVLDAQVVRVHPPLLTDPAVRACIDSLPPVAFGPALVSISAMAPLSGHRPGHDAANLLAQDVGARVREMLEAAPGSVPDASSKLPWQAVWGSVRFRLRTEGTIHGATIPLHSAGDSLAREGSELLRRALDSLATAGERWLYAGPEGAEIEFVLHFSFADRVDAPRRQGPMPIVSVPVFTHRVPIHRPTRWVPTGAAPRYPDRMRFGGVTAAISVRFQVDASGTPIAASLEELSDLGDGLDSPDGMTITGMGGSARPPFKDADAEQRRLFVASIRDALPRMRVQRGQVGACVLPDRFESRFLFLLPEYGPAVRVRP